MDVIEEGMPWEYRGEGNSSLVLVSPKSHIVLRLRKIRPPKPLSGQTSFSEAESSMSSLVSYVDHVIRPMLPCSNWIPKMRVIPLPDNTSQFFPDTAARDARRMNEQHSFHKEAIVMRDLCFLTSDASSQAVTFSVEIKPKEGVLPTGEGVHPARKEMSKYRLKQIMKVQEGIIQTSNEYDPMDLFSGNHDRMKVALHTLVAHPQNNFKIFVNGVAQFDTRNPGKENLDAVMAKLLPADIPDKVDCLLDLVITALTQADAQETSLKPKSGILDSRSILGALLEAQKTCEIDIEPLYPQYQEMHKKLEDQPGLRKRLGIDGPDYATAPFWTGEGMEEIGVNEKEKGQLLNCRDYLAAATVKDCSVFLTFRNVSSDENDSQLRLDESSQSIVELRPNLKFLFAGSFVDLDPKPFDRIEKHYVESQKLIELAGRRKQ